MKSPVVIVSAFGRGQSLAARLAEQEIPVRLIDLSSQLGTTAPEDEEGPFGVFLSGLHSTSMERLHQDDPLGSQAEGLTLCLRSGPVEMTSPLTKLRLEKLGLNLGILETLRELREGKLKNVAKWLTADARQTWLLELASSYASNQMHFHPEILNSGIFLPIDAEFRTRSVTRPGLAQSLEWCVRKGVQVEKDWIVSDLARAGRRSFKGLQVRRQDESTTQILEFEQLIWCLSSEETAFLSPEIQEKIFPAGILKPQWVWTRFRLRLPQSPEREVLPGHTLWIQDLELPWTHENFMVLQKHPALDLLDAWIRIPFDQRLQKAYLNEKLEKVLGILEKRFVTVKPGKAEEPLTGEKSYRDVGPARHPIFDPRAWLAWRAPNEENFWLHAPEVWKGLGWNAIFKQEDKLVLGTEAWWKKREAARIAQEKKGLST